MSNLPAVTGNRLIKALKKLGFEVVRTKGSHHFLKHPDGRCTVIPLHAGENIGRGLMAQIMRDCELAVEDLKKIL
ncbi:MAG TPA: type II toxin-antitoxin system HicA family toxin [Deltaproteobacteria bacterium]|nr:type II toxin-antitoxin system HicA family toxin [Deltaproteobacteria bacterium]HPR55621.1 type II toxin-antitoxin system HicA family toxin [Deltaproteobacteria bacterium]HXK48312.1 type II toxin-antitoxin system HicA family toxin [Deltaproteobacteria bacterium]